MSQLNTNFVPNNLVPLVQFRVLFELLSRTVSLSLNCNNNHVPQCTFENPRMSFAVF